MTFQFQNDIFLLITGFTWWLSFHIGHSQTTITRTPILNLKSATLNIGIMSLLAVYVFVSENLSQQLLPWMSLVIAINHFYQSEPNDECFWRKRRNLVIGTLFLSMVNITAGSLGIFGTTLTSLHLFLILRKSITTLSHTYGNQVNDFKGLQSKLRKLQADRGNLKLNTYNRKNPDESSEIRKSA